MNGQEITTFNDEKYIYATLYGLDLTTSIIECEYTFIEQLNANDQSTISLYMHKQTKQIVIVKIIQGIYFNNGQQIREYINKLQQINHPNIAKILRYIVFDGSQQIILISQYIKGFVSQLMDYESVKIFIRKIAEALYCCHKQGIMHQNLKLSNIFTNPPTLLDFGIASLINGQLQLIHRNDHDYLAPEILQGQLYTKSSDIWSLGIIMYKLLYDKLPFRNESITKKCQFKIPNRKISSDAIDILSKMLQKNPLSRITIEEILNHNYLQSFQCIRIDKNITTKNLELLTIDETERGRTKRLSHSLQCTIDISKKNFMPQIKRISKSINYITSIDI